MSNCSLKCSILPCIHTLKNNNELDFYGSKENILQRYKNELNIDKKMEDFKNISDNCNVDKKLNDKSNMQIEKCIKSNMNIKLKEFNFEELTNSFQKDKKNILLNTYNYYFHNNFFDLNETEKNEETNINIHYYKRLSLNIMSFDYEKDYKQDKCKDNEKPILFKSEKCNFNQKIFRTASYDDIFLKKIKISRIDKSEKKCIKKYKIPFEPNFYSNRFFFSDKYINDDSLHLSDNCTKYCNSLYINNDNSVLNTNKKKFKNFITHILYILRFEGPPPHFLIIKFNKKTKKAVIVKKVPVNKNISFNMAKFIAEKYIQILRKNLRKKEKKMEKIRNSDNNYDNNQMIVNNCYVNDEINHYNNHFEFKRDIDNNLDSNNNNNRNIDSSERSLIKNDKILNEFNEDYFNNYLLNTDINSLSYENYNSENICNEKICANEYLNIDLEKIVFNTYTEKYIKFLNNIKIYFLKKVDDIKNCNINNKNNTENKIVILVNIKYGSSVKSKIFIFVNQEDMKSEYEFIDIVNKKQNDNTFSSILYKNTNNSINESYNNYKNNSNGSINSDTHINIKINNVNIIGNNNKSNNSINDIHNNTTCNGNFFINNNESNTTNENNENGSIDIYKHEHSDYIFSADNTHEKALNKEISDDDTVPRYNSDKSEDDNKNNITLINKEVRNLDYFLEDKENKSNEISISNGKNYVDIEKKKKMSQKYKRKIINFIRSNIYINSYIYYCFENTDVKNNLFKDDVILIDNSKTQLVNNLPNHIYELNKFVFIKFIKFENYIKRNHKIAERYIKHLLQSNVKCINNYMIGMRWVPDIFAYEYYVCKITELNSEVKENKKNLKHNYSLALQKDANKNSIKYLVDYENKIIDNVLCVLHEYYQTSLFTEKCIFNLFKLVLLRVSMYADVMNKKIITLDLDKAIYRMKKFSEPININDFCTLSENENLSTNKNMDIDSKDVSEVNKNNLLKSSNWNNLSNDINFLEYTDDNIKNKNNNIGLRYIYNDDKVNKSNDNNEGIQMNHVSDSDIKKSGKSQDKYNNLFIKNENYEKESSLQNKYKNKKKVSYNLDNTSISLKKRKTKEKGYGLLEGEPFCLKYYSSSANNMLVNMENHKKGYYSNTSDLSSNSHITKHKYHLRSNNAHSTDNYSSEEYMTRSNLRNKEKGRSKMVYKLMNKNGLIEPYWWFFYNIYTNTSVQSDKSDPLKMNKAKNMSKKGEESINLYNNYDKSVKGNDNDDYRKILKKCKMNLLNHFCTRNNKIKIKYISMVHDIIYKKFILLKNTIFPRHMHEAEIIFTLFPHEAQTFMFVYTDDNLNYQNQNFLKYVSFSDYIITCNKIDDNNRDKNNVHEKNVILPIEEYNNSENNKTIDKDFYIDHFIIGDSKDTSNVLVDNNFKYSYTPNYDKIKRNYREAYYNSKEINNVQNSNENKYNIKILLNNVEGNSDNMTKNNSNNEKYKNNYIYNNNNNDIVENKSTENYHKVFDFEKNKREIKQNGYYDYFLHDKNLLNTTEKFHNVGEKRSVSSTNFGRSKYYENNVEDEEKKNTSDNDISLIKRRRNGSKRAKSNNLSNAKNYSMYNKNDVNNEDVLIPMGPLPTGVYFDSARKLWRCQWKENGKFKTKGFSLIHYNTLEEARKQCIIYRCEVGNIPVKSEWLNPIYVSSSYFFNKKCASSANNGANYSNKELKTSSLNLNKLKEKTTNSKSFIDGSNKNSSENYYNSRYSTKNNISTNFLNNEKSDDIDISILKEFVSKNKGNNPTFFSNTDKGKTEMDNINSENNKMKTIKEEKKELLDENDKIHIKNNNNDKIKKEINSILNDNMRKNKSNLNNEENIENFNNKYLNIYNTSENPFSLEEKNTHNELKNNISINNERHSLHKRHNSSEVKEDKLNEINCKIEDDIKNMSDNCNIPLETKIKFNENVNNQNNPMSHSDNDNNLNYYNKKKNDQDGCSEYDNIFNEEMVKEKNKNVHTSTNSFINKQYSSDVEDSRLDNLKKNTDLKDTYFNKYAPKDNPGNFQYHTNQESTLNISDESNINKEGSNFPEIFFKDIQNFLNFVKEKECASDNTHASQEEDHVTHMKKKNTNNAMYENYLKSIIVQYENEEKKKYYLRNSDNCNNNKNNDITTNNDNGINDRNYNGHTNKLKRDDNKDSQNESTYFKNTYNYSFLNDKEKSADFLRYIKKISNNNKRAINHIEEENSGIFNKSEECNNKYDSINDNNSLADCFENNSKNFSEKNNSNNWEEGNKSKLDSLKYMELINSEKECNDGTLKNGNTTNKLIYNDHGNDNGLNEQNINCILKKDIPNAKNKNFKEEIITTNININKNNYDFKNDEISKSLNYNKALEYDSNGSLNMTNGSIHSYYKNNDSFNKDKKNMKTLDNNINLIQEKRVKESLEDNIYNSLSNDIIESHNITNMNNDNYESLSGPLNVNNQNINDNNIEQKLNEYDERMSYSKRKVRTTNNNDFKKNNEKINIDNYDINKSNNENGYTNNHLVNNSFNLHNKNNNSKNVNISENELKNSTPTFGKKKSLDIDINLIKQSLPKGIYYDHAKKLYRVQYIINNSIKTKGFSVKKLGLVQAKIEAESFRNFCLENGLLNSRKRRINSPYNKKEENFKMIKDNEEILSNLLYLYNSNNKPR
ncbi:transcription factor with AP2 domain(s), putative [Plasmodium gallinaceum]|uniref:Transcription factor with AP2 domain(S), putative n=1 Tax=Plasmodium gallinaceum TaxID=5849 RepID=A0A1J1GLN6_PLAGA|nr:transcription factor with AP2 domain(s), putative [Plasmodium gallinaceum]CRG93235.1 transcription factor with AP2 domain(s), putative [Plasmodium gallinaceum]